MASKPKHKRLDGAEAVRRAREAPETVWFWLSDTLLQFGWTEQETLAEIHSGRLAIEGIPDPTTGGYKEIRITVKALLDWGCHPDAPQSMRDRVFKKADPV